MADRNGSKNQSDQLFMVFDCESIGLHGETFAVGWVLVDRAGRERESGSMACDPRQARGNADGRAWVQEHCPPPPDGYNCDSPRRVRNAFWHAWQFARAQGAVMVADCCWPVEARFLAACVDDAPGEREWGGPYPLHDVASVRLAAGLDPLATVERLPGELPIHDPLADARQSARLLIEALTSLER
jgi:hypothetical protein